MDRRSFLKTVTLACVSVPAAALASSEQEQIAPRMDDDGNIVCVSYGYALFKHRHELEIPVGSLEDPPSEGVELRTSMVFAHSHAVSLTQEQLRKIARGTEVIVKDSTVGEHTFLIYLPE